MSLMRLRTDPEKGWRECYRTKQQGADCISSAVGQDDAQLEGTRNEKQEQQQKPELHEEVRCQGVLPA